jgi:cytohesin
LGSDYPQAPEIVVRSLILALGIGLAFLSAPAVGTATDLDQRLSRSVVGMNYQEVRRLLEQGANPDFERDGRSLLGWAAQMGDAVTAAALLAAGANPNLADGAGFTPLMYAVSLGHAPVIEALLKARPDLSLRSGGGKGLGRLAVETGSAEIVQALLKAGADFNAADPDERSPVLVAAQGVSFAEDTLEIIALLGAHGVDLNAGDRFLTPLYFAVMQGEGRLAAALLAAGADPNRATPEGRIPLIQALGDLAMLQLLLQAGADPNAKKASGRSVLFAALDRGADTAMGPGTLEALDALIKAGADVNRPDPSGRTPLAYAEDLRLDEMADLLRAQGASNPSAPPEAAVSDVPVTPAPVPDNEYDALPKIRMVGKLSGTGSGVSYYSDAPVEEIVAFYLETLPAAGWELADRHGDDQGYAVMQLRRGSERMTLTLSRETGRASLRVTVSLVPHGTMTVSALPRYRDSEVLFEQDSMAIYLTPDAVPKVAEQTAALLKESGWQGGLTAQTKAMRHPTLARDSHELTVYVSVAPAQGNKTTIQYSLRQQ